MCEVSTIFSYQIVKQKIGLFFIVTDHFSEIYHITSISFGTKISPYRKQRATLRDSRRHPPTCLHQGWQSNLQNYILNVNRIYLILMREKNSIVKEKLHMTIRRILKTVKTCKEHKKGKSKKKFKVLFTIGIINYF